MNYQMYRSATIGEALISVLDMLVKENMISEALSQKILANFDRAINNLIPQRTKNRITFKAKKLRAYRFCDNVWTFVMEDVDIKDNMTKQSSSAKLMKIVACDAARRVT
uniref:Transcription initiation factor IIA subunit 2 n=1 Tax=Panagrellus redivivus TaxID=6233 RepID=A0A7E4W9X3_PANRE